MVASWLSESVVQVRVSRWGEGLGVLIPQDAASRVGLTEGSVVEISVEDGRLLLTPATARYRLAELLEGVTPEAMRDAFEWDTPHGRKII